MKRISSTTKKKSDKYVSWTTPSLTKYHELAKLHQVIMVLLPRKKKLKL